MAKIVVLGSFNMDLVMRAERQPARGETLQGEFAMFRGGKGYNQAVAAARLGAEVSVIGRVGDDEFGRDFLEGLAAHGIEHGNVSLDADTGTGVAAIVVDASGENAIIQAPRANRALTATHVCAASSALAGAEAALLQLETSDAAAIAFAQAARKANARVVLNPAPAGAVPVELLALADVVVPNATEARALTGIQVEDVESAFEAAGWLRERFGCTAVVTLGERGAVAVTSEGRFHEHAHQVEAIDTVGAGDAFCAALTVALAEGRELREAVRFGAAAGALAVTRAGAEPSMPARAEIEQLLEKERGS